MGKIFQSCAYYKNKPIAKAAGNFPGSFFICEVIVLCRRKDMHCCCLLCFALGMLVGHWIDSGVWCWVGALVLVCLGFSVASRR